MSASYLKSDLVSAAQIGRQVGVSRYTILRRARRNEIPSYRFGKTLVRFDPTETIQALLAAGRASTAADPEKARDGADPIASTIHQDQQAGEEVQDDNDPA